MELRGMKLVGGSSRQPTGPVMNVANDNGKARFEGHSLDHSYWEEGCAAALDGHAIESNPYAIVDGSKFRIWLVGFRYCQRL